MYSFSFTKGFYPTGFLLGKVLMRHLFFVCCCPRGSVVNDWPAGLAKREACTVTYYASIFPMTYSQIVPQFSPINTGSFLKNFIRKF